MGRLPIIKSLVAIVDWGEKGGNDTGCEEAVEGRDGLDSVGTRNSGKTSC